MVDAAEEGQVGQLMQRLRARYEERATLASDRERAEELIPEAEPAAEAVLVALGASPGAEAARREGATLAVLLGRRVGSSGVTPTGLLALLDALGDAFEDVGQPWPADLAASVRSACAEGYVIARDEEAAQEADRRAAEAIPVLRLSPRTLGLVLAGEQSSDRVAEVVDELGRTLFDTDAAACVVDVSGLRGPGPRLAAEVLAVDGLARLLGATCVFCGVSDAWRAAFGEAGAVEGELMVEPDFASALRRALASDGLAVRTRGGWPGRVRQWLAPKG